ncbi:MAG: precorrin-6A reductase [Syntrophomonadaceae bacterium]|nr:precorrin-6A reductase [Syntrophomonadaceae bacterium]
MILLLGGTREAREVACCLQQQGKAILFSSATELGLEILGAAGAGIELRAGSLNADQIADLLQQRRVKLVLDCTHPFSADISRNAMKACQKRSVRYLRLERPATSGNYSGLIRARDFVEAAERAAEIEGSIMLTIGVKHLPEFLSRRRPGQQLIARVLPRIESIQRCQQLGFAPSQLIAAQGSFSVEFNRALFSEYRVTAVVAKDSGLNGGTEAKLEAARQLGIKFILVERPNLEYFEVFRSVEELVEVALKEI